MPERQPRRESSRDDRLGLGNALHQPVDPRVRYLDLQTATRRMAPTGSRQPSTDLLRQRGQAVRISRPEYGEARGLEHAPQRAEVIARSRRSPARGVRADERQPAWPEHAPELRGRLAVAPGRQVLEDVEARDYVEPIVGEGQCQGAAADQREAMAAPRVRQRLGAGIDPDDLSDLVPTAPTAAPSARCRSRRRCPQLATTPNRRCQPVRCQPPHPLRPPVRSLDLGQPVEIGGLVDRQAFDHRHRPGSEEVCARNGRRVSLAGAATPSAVGRSLMGSG